MTALSEDGETPLHVAARYSHMPVVEYLTLEEDCDPSLMFTAARGSSLHSAAFEGYIDVARFFIETFKCDPNITSGLGQTPLYVAANRGHLEFVKFLIEEFGCDPMMTDNAQCNALHASAIGCHVPVCNI